ncbi:MAG: hypothetical protein KF819_21980 [Labilithrix sp.]|nr:hypothetical protein [Labilithrix sp.]
MRRLSTMLGAAVALALTASCEDVVVDAGLDAGLRVDGAQFFRRAMPAETSGPGVRNVVLAPTVLAGSATKVSGDLEPTATAIAVGLDGDPGYWVVPAGLPDVTAPGFPTFVAGVSFAPMLRAGAKSFVARAIDAGGNFGPPLVRPLNVNARVPPPGKLVVSLTWMNQADLDLHVVDPNGTEIWKRNVTSYQPPPPGSPPEPPGTVRQGGVLDFDSNASCVQDGRRAENVVWTTAPPPGRYVARVDTFSLCGQVNAYWRVEVFVDGVSVKAAEGLATEIDSRAPHDRGAGVLALEIDIPASAPGR